MSININLYNEDCLKGLKKIKDKSIDLIYCDLPYCGITNNNKGSEVACKWNTPVDLDLLWKEFKRIRKDKTPIFFCCSTKFGYSLIKANEKEYRYDLIWVKSASCGFLNARRMPMKKHENIYVFYKKCPSEVYYNNIKKYHKHKFIKDWESKRDGKSVYRDIKKESTTRYTPSLPSDVIKEDKTIYNEKNRKHPIINGCNSYDPKLPSDVIYNTCNVYNNGNKLPDHRDKDKKGVQFDPMLPTDVLKENDKEYETLYGKVEIPKHPDKGSRWNPPLPNDILKESDIIDSSIYDTKERNKPIIRSKTDQYIPKLPTDVIKENDLINLYNNMSILYNDVLKYKNDNIIKNDNSKEDEIRPAEYINLPVDVLELKSEKYKHQTQKPIALTDFILKYYSNEGDNVLDPTFGSGGMGLSCKNYKCNFIGYELDKDIFNIGKDRINNYVPNYKNYEPINKG